MLATVLTSRVRGLEARPVEVQVDISSGVAGFFLVGLASGSVREAKERARAAIRNSGLEFPHRRLTVNLAPAELRKEGSALDLPIAVAIALTQIGKAPPRRTAFLGELSLDGAVRHVDGVLVAARWLHKRGYEHVFVPAADAAEAALVKGLEVIPCTNLGQVVGHLVQGHVIEPQPPTEPVIEHGVESSEYDLA